MGEERAPEANMKILFVEDEKTQAAAMKRLLEKTGEMEVEISDGPEPVLCAIGKLGHHHYDFVLIDIQLKSVYNGTDVGKVCHRMNVPFVYLTNTRVRPGAVNNTVPGEARTPIWDKEEVWADIPRKILSHIKLFGSNGKLSNTAVLETHG